jgi:hypothetical protein
VNKTGMNRNWTNEWFGLHEIPFEVAVLWLKLRFPEENITKPEDWLNNKW